MQRINAFLALSLTLATALVAATDSDLPKNLLRYNMGALPMTQNSNGQWTDVAPDSIDWKAPYAAVLAGDLGKTVDLSSTKTFIVDFKQVESINRFSLFSKTATGSLTVYSSPVFETPESAKWSELGTLSLNAGKPSTLNATPTDARYVKFVFSTDSKGEIGSMGAFGAITYGDVRAADLLQATNSTQVNYSCDYATPATQLKIVSSTPAHTEEELLPLFADDPAATFTVTEPTSIVIDLTNARQISSGYVLSGDKPNASVSFGGSEEELKTAKPVHVIVQAPALSGYSPYSNIGANDLITARFAQININPSNGSSTIGGISLIGPIDPNALVFDRNASAEDVAAGPSAVGPLPPVPPVVPRITTF